LSGGRDFWSRRKAAVEAEAEAEARQRVAAQQADERAELAQKTDEEILAELNLQDPDTLESGDDFAAFLQSAVPERLRRRALRRLWRSNPVLANLDDLVDYGEDYTGAGALAEKIQTAYQVGQGMLRHVRERALPDGPEAPAPATEPAHDAAAPMEQGEQDAARGAGAPDEPADSAGEVAQARIDPLQDDPLQDDIAPSAPPVRHRMRFQFDAQDIADTMETPAYRHAGREEGK